MRHNGFMMRSIFKIKISPDRNVIAVVAVSVILLLTLFSPLCWAKPIAVRVGITQDPPILWMDEQGEVKGFFADILTYVAEQQDWQLEYVSGSWCELIPQLQDGDIDLLPSVYPEIKAHHRIALSRSPVLLDWGQVYSLNPEQIQTILDLDGKRVAVESSCIFYDGIGGIKDLADRFNVNIDFVAFDVTSKGLQALRRGEVDAIVLGRFYNNMPTLGDDIVKTPILLNPITSYFGSSKSKESSLLLVLDHYVDEMKGDRSSIYYRSWDHWFSQSMKSGLPSWLVEVAVMVVAIVLSLIGFSLFARYQVEKKTREISEKNDQLRLLSMALTLAEEKERRRLSELLHDNLGQNLALAKIRLCSMAAAHGGQSCQQALGEIKVFLTEAIHSTRSLTAEMSPPVLYDLSFVAAIKWLADRIFVVNGIQHKVVSSGKSVVLPENTKVLLFKTVRELLVNSVKHSQAGYVQIDLNYTDTTLYLTIHDDGIGMPDVTVDRSSKSASGFGLMSINERITYLGGEFKIMSQPNHGTIVALQIPLDGQS